MAEIVDDFHLLSLMNLRGGWSSLIYIIIVNIVYVYINKKIIRVRSFVVKMMSKQLYELLFVYNYAKSML